MSNVTEISDLLKRDGVITEKQENTDNIKPYTMRKLSSKDISPMLKILRKLNFKKIKEAIANIDFSQVMKVAQEQNETVATNSEDVIDSSSEDIEQTEL